MFRASQSRVSVVADLGSPTFFKVPLMFTLLLGLFCIVSSLYGVFTQHRKVKKYGKSPRGNAHSRLGLNINCYRYLFYYRIFAYRDDMTDASPRSFPSLLIRLFVYTFAFCLIMLMGNREYRARSMRVDLGSADNPILYQCAKS
jgi:hypothetical protein